MAEETNARPNFRFTLEEISGAFGDSITVIPLLVGIGLTTEANLAHLLLFFAVFQIGTGLLYKLPMPVEPMKALAALAIAGTLTYDQVLAAGIVLGMMLFFSGTAGAMNWLDEFVPVSVVRGVQLGLALLLLKTSADYVTNNFWLASVGIGIVLLFLYLKTKYGYPNLSAFIVLALGAAIGIYLNGAPEIALMELPRFNFPAFTSFLRGVINGALPQFFLSVGNAILATTLLFKDLLKREVNPDKLSQSMGIMCIVSSLFGAFPACHGSGGLSGQYRFGARTGGSNLILGTVYLGIALIGGSASFLSFFPVSVLGALLVFIALELVSAAAKTDKWTITLMVAILSFFTNLAVGFIAGLVQEKILVYLRENS